MSLVLAHSAGENGSMLSVTYRNCVFAGTSFMQGRDREMFVALARFLGTAGNPYQWMLYMLDVHKWLLAPPHPLAILHQLKYPHFKLGDWQRYLILSISALLFFMVTFVGYSGYQ